MKKSNITPFPKDKKEETSSSLVSSLSPREIVSELDRFVVGQNKAKKAVAIALRNRWRRQALKGEMKNEILPKNILMMGPTGVGKTEISRRLSKLAEAPFVKVEATRFTEVGYVGRDVEQIIRDLLEIAIAMEKVKKTGNLQVPIHLRNAPTKLMKDLGYGKGYMYAHDFKDQFADQEFLPDEISGTKFYEPGENPKEKNIRDFLKFRWKDKYDY